MLPKITQNLEKRSENHQADPKLPSKSHLISHIEFFYPYFFSEKFSTLSTLEQLLFNFGFDEKNQQNQQNQQNDKENNNNDTTPPQFALELLLNPPGNICDIDPKNNQNDSSFPHKSPQTTLKYLDIITPTNSPTFNHNIILTNWLIPYQHHIPHLFTPGLTYPTTFIKTLQKNTGVFLCQNTGQFYCIFCAKYVFNTLFDIFNLYPLTQPSILDNGELFGGSYDAKKTQIRIKILKKIYFLYHKSIQKIMQNNAEKINEKILLNRIENLEKNLFSFFQKYLSPVSNLLPFPSSD